MPNHVSTKIKFETKEGFDLLLNKEEESVDFNTIIPMPEIISNDSISNEVAEATNYLCKERGIDFTMGFSFNPITKEKFEKLSDSVKEGAERMIKAKLETGHFDWYGWRIHHWGTKWGAYNSTINEETLTIYFDTAWSTPQPIFEKLAELLPNDRFVAEYADEDLGSNCGSYTNEGGILIWESKVNDIEFACKLTGYDYQEYLKDAEQHD